eukprot:scaffold14344_cov69-Skeletonema_menzelii.AAC.1
MSELSFITWLVSAAQRVWNIFSIIFFLTPAEALSNSCTAAELSFQPKAPKFSCACAKLRAPGI